MKPQKPQEMTHKNAISAILAIAAMTILIFLATLLTPSKTHAQSSFIVPLGSAIGEVEDLLERHVHWLDDEATSDELRLNNPTVEAVYSFESGQLNKLRIEKQYTSSRLAKAGLRNYLLYLQRIKADVVSVQRTGAKVHYVAVLGQGAYELTCKMKKTQCIYRTAPRSPAV